MPEGRGAALDAAVARYERLDARTRWHIRLRRALACLERVEAQVPVEGDVLEVGCGHGLFAHFLAQAAPGRRVLGVDIDERKIEVALQTVVGGEWVRFQTGDALALPDGPYDAVVIVDVLYLLDAEGQRRALAEAHRVLRPGGRLIWKSSERRPRWKFALTFGQEWLATRSGVTAGAALCFLARQEALWALEVAGFHAPAIDEIRSRVYADLLYVGTASSGR